MDNKDKKPKKENPPQYPPPFERAKIEGDDKKKKNMKLL